MAEAGRLAGMGLRLNGRRGGEVQMVKEGEKGKCQRRSCRSGNFNGIAVKAASGVPDGKDGSWVSSGGSERGVEGGSSERGASFILGNSFYRRESALGRDLAMLAAALYRESVGSLRVMDVMCGSGVRALRYMVHAGADFVWANDASPATHPALLHNLTHAGGAQETGSRSEAEGCEHASVTGQALDDVCVDNGGASSDSLIDAVEFSKRFRGRNEAEGGAASVRWNWEGDGSSGLTVESDRWRITHEDANRILFHCYQVKDYYDLIDVDSFGSDSVFLGSALMAIRRGGLLYATSTDGFSSGGHAPFRSLGAYGAYIRPLPYANELGLRMLIGGVVREAATRGLTVQPVFSHYSFHGPVFRTLLRVLPQKQWKASNYKFIAHCFACGNVATLEWSELGSALCRSSVHGHEPRQMAVIGPMWTGPLHSRADVAAMARLAEEWSWTNPTSPSKGSASSSRSMQKGAGQFQFQSQELAELLGIMAEESDPELLPGYIHLDQIARIGRIPTPRRKDLIAALHERGYKASRSHVESNSVKTNCSMAECIHAAEATMLKKRGQNSSTEPHGNLELT